MEVEIDAGIDVVWKAFTTTEGIQSWMAPLANIDLTIGGNMRAKYNPKGKLGDETTIENTTIPLTVIEPSSMEETVTHANPQLLLEMAARGNGVFLIHTAFNLINVPCPCHHLATSRQEN